MTVTNYLIPLTADPQSFAIDLAGTTYNISIFWNDSPDAGWTLDLQDADNNDLACNIPFVTGVDMLAGLDYLDLGGSLYVYTDGDASAVPTLTNLGIDSNLYFQVVTNP